MLSYQETHMVQRKVMLLFCILRGTGHRVVSQEQTLLPSLAKSKDKNKSLLQLKQISSSYSATWCVELTHQKRPWCWERLRAGGEGDNRGWDGWMASPTRWTWVWVDSGSWWWTGRPGVLWFMGSQGVRHDWVTELNSAYCFLSPCKNNLDLVDFRMRTFHRFSLGESENVKLTS